MKKRFCTAKPVPVGEGYSVEFTYTRDGIVAEWTPDVPKEIGHEAFYSYQLALMAFVSARCERRTGDVGNGVVAEIR